MTGRNQRKKAENTQNQNASPSKDDHSSTSTMEQGLMENGIPMTESLFMEWIIRNFGELKDHVVAQRKETRNFEKMFDEILLRIDNLERSMSELMELKNTIQKGEY